MLIEIYLWLANISYLIYQSDSTRKPLHLQHSTLWDSCSSFHCCDLSSSEYHGNFSFPHFLPNPRLLHVCKKTLLIVGCNQQCPLTFRAFTGLLGSCFEQYWNMGRSNMFTVTCCPWHRSINMSWVSELMSLCTNSHNYSTSRSPKILQIVAATFPVASQQTHNIN